MSINQRQLERRHDLTYRAMCNRLYYEKRQFWFNLFENGTKGAGLALALGVMSVFKSDTWFTWAAAAVAIMGVLALVFRWGDLARDATNRANNWRALHGAITKVDEDAVTDEMLSEWSSKAAEYEQSEPAAIEFWWRSSEKRARVILGIPAET